MGPPTALAGAHPPPALSAPGMAKHNKAKLQQLQQLQQMHQMQQLQQLQHARPHVHRQPNMGNLGMPPSRPQSAQMLADSNAGRFLPGSLDAVPEPSFLPDSTPAFPLPRRETVRARELMDGTGGRMEKTQVLNVWRVPGL